jgi:hypothetical protein
VSASEAYIKKITVACPIDKGDAGRLTIIVNKCSIVRMPLAGIRPGDGGTLTIIANKCSIVRNAPCRMNMHPPQRPDPCPLLPRSELHHRRPPVLPRRHAHVALCRFVWRCTCEEQGSRLPEQPQSLHRLGSSQWAKRLSTGPLPGLGMAWVVKGRTQKEGESHGRLYFKCARNSVSCLLCLPNLS